jgi:hypothetical protein
MIALAMVFLTARVTAAREGTVSWENLNVVRPGQKIEVVDMKLKSYKGGLAAVTDEGITLRVGKDEVTVARGEVVRVSLRENSKRGRNELIGVATGAGAGAVPAGIAAKACANEGGSCPGPVFGMLGVGASLGAGIGAAFPGYQTVYRAPHAPRGSSRSDGGE